MTFEALTRSSRQLDGVSTEHRQRDVLALKQLMTKAPRILQTLMQCLLTAEFVTCYVHNGLFGEVRQDVSGGLDLFLGYIDKFEV